jgi:effector-binding domain-containing protein
MSFNPIQVALQAQHYAAIRVQVRREDIGTDVPALYAEVHEWLTKRKIAVTGPALIRYLAIDPSTQSVDIHVGFPIAAYTAVHERVEFSVQPPGTYVIAVHRGAYESLHKTTALLLDWGAEHGVQWQTTQNGSATEWAGRFEHYLIGPVAESNPRNWHTEIAMLRRQASK